MTIKERIALARAGYSKKEIEKLAQDEAAEPKQDEQKQEETEPKQEAAQIADSFTDPAQGETVPAWAQNLLDRFTANQILMSNQPPEETTESICAKIIEPYNSFDPNK